RSEQAIAALSQKYEKICTKIAMDILNDPLDAEECVNDTYLGVWTSIPPQRPNPLMAYVCQITRNLSIKRYRANTAQKRKSNYALALEELQECIPSTETVEREYADRELARLLNAFLATLDADNRAMFVRRYWYSESVSDIAAAFETTPHYISVRLGRTREKLKKYLRKEGITL
ncbi:MAG: sigma-70 family RNA polymerase sigma factor, partial [Clostridia bacterium]|nr:sigma-70 family RNA polymerase sigma factor [Clostridia bacterium]